MNINFTSPLDYDRGIIAHLLKESYRELVLSNPRLWRQEEAKWDEFDEEVFLYPDSVGNCVFLTLLERRIIGFGSYDPRHKPEYGIIGHNCILPKFRGKGYGKRQLLEILRRFQSIGIKTAKASTNSHPFFIPARRMYMSCGFMEVGRRPWDVDYFLDIIEYKMGIG
jgi:GNAT superfamily N-acetyltransferase